MRNSSINRAAFKIGSAIIDPDRRQIRHNDRLIDVEPRVFELLLYLVQSEGAVSRLELLDSIWGVEGSDEALTQSISKLRRILCDTDRPYQIIETIPKIGYRLAVQPTDTQLTSTGNPRFFKPNILSIVQKKFEKNHQYIIGAGTGAGLVALGFFLGSLTSEPQNVEREIECPEHWTVEDCMKLVDDLVR